MVVGPAAVAIVAGFVFWALKALGKLPTVRVVLMFAVGCGLTGLVGPWVVTVFTWVKQAVSGLPSSWQQVIVYAPAGLALAGTLFVVFALLPRERPHQRAERFALIVPLLALIVAGGVWGANAHKIVNNTNQATTQLVATIVHHGGK